MKKYTTTLQLAAILGAITVVIGAFGAHGLRPNLSADAFNSFETAVKYQFYHVLALLFVGLLQAKSNTTTLVRVAQCFIIGIVLFSGSIYFLATKALHNISVPLIGIITPIGGVFFIVGWLLLAWSIRKTSDL
jgi:uncharacterized membrane protein YgdD (TMEM256/DUF423 family)